MSGERLRAATPVSPFLLLVLSVWLSFFLSFLQIVKKALFCSEVNGGWEKFNDISVRAFPQINVGGVLSFLFIILFLTLTPTGAESESSPVASGA